MDLIAISLVTAGFGLVLLIVEGALWLRRRRNRRIAAARLAEEQELARRKEQLLGSATLRSDREDWSRGKGVGQIALLAVGTAAANQLVMLLEAFWRAGAAAFVGPILLAEPDIANREACLDAIPPIFRSRVTALALPLLPGGLLGRTATEARDLQRYWTADLNASVEAWMTKLRREAEVVFLHANISPGGSGALGWPILQRFKAEYDQAEIFVQMVLDHKTERRALNIPDLLNLYGQGKVVKGFIIGDNRTDVERFDQGSALLFPSMVSGPWIDLATPQSGINVLADIFRTHRVATLRTWAGWLPVSYLPPMGTRVPELYTTRTSFVEAQIIRGIEQVLTQDALQALPLAAAERPHFVYIAVAVRPDPDLRQIAERVRASLAADLDPDTTFAFASVGHPLTPASTQLPVAVVSLFPVRDGLEGVCELALRQPQAGASRPLRFLSGVELGTTSTNGKKD